MNEISNISTDEKLLPNQNDSATSHAEIAVSSELTELSTDEWRDRIFLERQVEKAFYAAAKALKEIRDRRLYRSTHSTFENYCRSRFGFTNRHVNYLIAGSLVVENLMGTNNSQIKTQDQTRTNGSQIEIPEGKRTNGSQILPTTHIPHP